MRSSNSQFSANEAAQPFIARYADEVRLAFLKTPSDSNALLLREVVSLEERLRASIENRIAIDASWFSPADAAFLQKVASRASEGRVSINHLAEAAASDNGGAADASGDAEEEVVDAEVVDEAK